MAYRTVSFKSALKLLISLTFELTKLKMYAKFEENWMVFHFMYPKTFTVLSPPRIFQVLVRGKYT